MRTFLIMALILASSPSFAQEAKTEKVEYHPGIEREYYLGVRKTVQAGFCTSPIPGAKVERSFLQDNTLFVVWRNGEQSRTIAYKLEGDHAVEQTQFDGAITRVQVNFGNFLRPNMRSFVLEGSLSNKKLIKDGSDLSLKEYKLSTPWTSAAKKNMPVEKKVNDALSAIHVWDEVPGRSHTDVFGDIRGYCEDRESSYIEGATVTAPADTAGGDTTPAQ
jgi:hypothetical protein